MRVLMLVSSLDSYKRGSTDGFIVDWVRVLAKKVTSLTVLTYRLSSKENFPQNTNIVLIEGSNFLTRNISLFINTFKYAKRNDVIFAHILEVFGIAAGVVGKMTSKKSFLWYCQGYDLSKHIIAKIALVLVDKILTSTDEIKTRYIREVGKHISNKIEVVGHGINLTHYA